MRCPTCNQLTEISDVYCIQCRTLLRPQQVKIKYEQKEPEQHDKLQDISIHILVALTFFALLTLALHLSFAIVTPQTYLMDFLIKYVAVPIGIVLGIVLRNSQNKRDRWRKLSWISLLTHYIIGYILLSMAVPVLILWVNAAFVRDENLVISGKVLYKEIIDKRKAPNQNLIHLMQLEDKNNISLDIPLDLYNQVPLGATFIACYKIGLFKIPFQWRKNYQGGCSYSFESVSPS